MWAWTSIFKGLRKFASDRRGTILLKFALGAPAVGVLGLGAIDLQAVYSAKAQLQEIADAAALSGARELSLAVNDDGPEGRANSYVDAHFSEWRDAPRTERTIEVMEMDDGSRALRVLLEANRPSFFANLLPPGGWDMRAEAIASSVNAVPLCVLTHGTDRDKVLNVKDQAQIRAPSCMIHSNRDIVVEGGRLSAAAVQVVTRASGSIALGAATGAAAIPDPFVGLPLGEGATTRDELRCDRSTVPRVVTSGRYRLAPGVHCHGLNIEGTAELVLDPGEHWFVSGALIIKENARLSGDDVVLLFDRTSKFEFKDSALVNLDGRESGPFAGMVMAAARGNTQDFIISSDQVESLLGVIYVPSATLIVEGSAEVARESAWTVIVAKYLQLKGAPQLFINADYRGSDVPVPDGVGPSGGSHLIR